MKKILLFAFAALAVGCGNQAKNEPLEYYLMTYFKDQTHAIYMAISPDGYTFTDLNGGEPVMRPDTLALQKGLRDPHIFRGPDGALYLSATDLHISGQRAGVRDTPWERDVNVYHWGNNRALLLMKSDDGINWSKTNLILTDLPGFEDATNAWAPATTWDEEAGRLLLTWTSRQTPKSQLKLWCAYVDDDYTKLTSEPRVLFEYPEALAYIDSDITKVGDRYYTFYTPTMAVPDAPNEIGIKMVSSERATGPYTVEERWVDPETVSCEGPTLFNRLGTDTWVLMYDVYGKRPNNMGFSETTDFVNFTDIGHFNEGVMKGTNFERPKHGAVTYLTRSQARKLAEHWGVDMEI